MGWLYMPRQSLGGHASAKSYLDAQFTHERPQEEGGSRGLKVLASACPGNRVYYAATQVMTNGVGGRSEERRVGKECRSGSQQDP